MKVKNLYVHVKECEDSDELQNHFDEYLNSLETEYEDMEIYSISAIPYNFGPHKQGYLACIVRELSKVE